MNGRWDVLVVDDEPVVRDALLRVLGDEGLSVALVPDAESALAHPALADCRLVICDIMLPGQSGLDAARAFRRLRPELPIVLITGYATAGSETRALEAGATAFLAKPFDVTELLDLIRGVLGRKDATRGEGVK
jgi:CheY-like chemotaxis protein